MGLQPVTTAGYRVTLLSTADSAIDRACSDLEAYTENGYDLKEITLTEDPDSPPTWFTLRALPKLTIGQLGASAPNDEQFMMTLFSVACDKVRGLKAIDHDTGEVFTVRPKWVNADGYKRLSDQTLEYIHPAVQVEMGEAAWHLSELGVHHLKNSSAPDWCRAGPSRDSASAAGAAHSSRHSGSPSGADDHHNGTRPTNGQEPEPSSSLTAVTQP